jgi:hypothetical protein
LADKLAAVARDAQLYGSSFDAVAARTAAIKATMQEAIAAGVDPLSARMQVLSATYQRILTDTQAAADAADRYAAAQARVTDAINGAKTPLQEYVAFTNQLRADLDAGDISERQFAAALDAGAAAFKAASTLTPPLADLAKTLGKQLEASFFSLGRGLMAAVAGGAESMKGFLKSTFLSVLGSLVDIGIRAGAGAIIGGPAGAVGGGASGFGIGFNTVAPTGNLSPLEPTIVVDMAGVSLFADPAAEARRQGSQVFFREAQLVAADSGA